MKRVARCGNDKPFYNAYRVAGNYLSHLAQMFGQREAPGSASVPLAQLQQGMPFLSADSLLKP